MKYSEPCNEICAALAKFQGAIESIGKDSRNKYTDSNYLSLGKLMSKVRPALSAQGMSIVQDNYIDGEYVVIETELRHASGQWIRGEPIRVRPVRAAKGAAPRTLSAEEAVTQEKAAAMTYMRRYAVFALCGLAGEDTDGNPDAVDDGDYNSETGETRASEQQSQQQEQRRQEPEQRAPTHRTGPEVDSAIAALPEVKDEAGMRMIARDLFVHHGPISSTKAWIAFSERSKALQLDARATARMAYEELQRERVAAEQQKLSAQGALPA